MVFGSVSLAIVVLPEEVTSAQSLSAGFAGLSLRRTAEGDITQGGRPSKPKSGSGLVSGLLVAEDSFDDFGVLG